MDSEQPTGSVTTVENRDPWSGQQPYLQFGFEQAKNNYLSDRPGYFPNATFAPFAPATEAGLGAIETRAAAGSPLLAGAQGQLGRVIAGDYLSPGNPYFGAVSDQVYGAVRPRLDAQFATSGNYGTPQHEYAMASALSNALAPLAYQNYASERAAQNQAVQSAPALAQADYADPAMLLQAGSQRQQQAQTQLQDQINRFNFDQNLPRQKLADYLTSVAGGNYGGATQSTQPYFSNAGNQNLGLGLNALSTIGALFSRNGPFG